MKIQRLGVLNADGRERVGNVANRQCPMCRSTDIDQKWTFGNYYFQCNKCGERFKDWNLFYSEYRVSAVFWICFTYVYPVKVNRLKRQPKQSLFLSLLFDSHKSWLLNSWAKRFFYNLSRIYSQPLMRKAYICLAIRTSVVEPDKPDNNPLVSPSETFGFFS